MLLLLFLSVVSASLNSCPECPGITSDYCIRYLRGGCISGFETVKQGCYNNTDYDTSFCAANGTENLKDHQELATVTCSNTAPGAANRTCLGAYCFYLNSDQQSMPITDCDYDPVPISPPIIYSTFLHTGETIPPGLNELNTCYGISSNRSKIQTCLCQSNGCNYKQPYPVKTSNTVICQDGFCANSVNGSCPVTDQCEGELCFIHRMHYTNPEETLFITKGCVSSSRPETLKPKYSSLRMKLNGYTSEAWFCATNGCNKNWDSAHPPFTTTTSTSTSSTSATTQSSSSTTIASTSQTTSNLTTTTQSNATNGISDNKLCGVALLILVSVTIK